MTTSITLTKGSIAFEEFVQVVCSAQGNVLQLMLFFVLNKLTWIMVGSQMQFSIQSQIQIQISRVNLNSH